MDTRTAMKISIITAAWNSAATIEDTLRSILAQTYQDWECIVIDGASSDGTRNILRSYETRFNGRLHWISEPDQGIYDAMNKGIAIASGQVIGMLNADDFYSANNILDQVAKAFTADKYLDGVYGDIHFVHPDDLSKTVRYYPSKSFTRAKMKFGFMPAHPSFYVKKEVYDRFGKFDIQYKIAADFESLLRYIYIHRIKTQYLDMDFVTMRTGGASTASLANRVTIMREHLRAFRNHGIKNNALRLSLRYFSKLWESVPHLVR